MKDLDFIDELMENGDLKILYKKCARAKADILFEEPCPIYEADENDWNDFWYGYND